MRSLLALLSLALLAGHSLQATSIWTERFLDQYNKIKNPSNGYFSKGGVPYYSIESLLVEAPDHGHESTSEVYSYWVWLEAMYGAVTGNFSSFNAAWKNLEANTIPQLQSSNSYYDPKKPATYAAELDDPAYYPSPSNDSVVPGVDPLFDELRAAYGNDEFYTMHWLLDVDNVYGFGNVQGKCEAGPNESGPSLFNTYQRGHYETVWDTIPQPTCDTFSYGGRHGFMDLFIKETSYARQYLYTATPSADARAIMAAYWAKEWATKRGVQSSIEGTIRKASKMGDYLRYTFFDKYFKKIGNCFDGVQCEPGTGKDSAHYLINWYFSWGGSYGAQYGWAWRIASSFSYYGYQSPMTAWALANDKSFQPKGATAVEDWTKSVERQIELYEYLQSKEGAFAGGVTNSYHGRYDYPEEELRKHTFYGMVFDNTFNRWYGYQPWTADQLAQYYYVTGNKKAETILAKWAKWIQSEIKFDKDGNFFLPDLLDWSGVPPNLHVNVTVYGEDVGTASATVRTLMYYAAKSGDSASKQLSKKLLDSFYERYRADKGIVRPEPHSDYNMFNNKVDVPSGWSGSYPRGDPINSKSTFLSIRSFYKKDPLWPKVEKYLNGGEVPTFVYHRFWAQVDIALSFALYGMLFNE